MSKKKTFTSVEVPETSVSNSSNNIRESQNIFASQIPSKSEVISDGFESLVALKTEILRINQGLDIFKNDTTEKIEQLNKDIKSKEEKIKELNENIAKFDNRHIETIAIFSTFFTFISVNVQIFSKLENLGQAIPFVIMMAIIMFCFGGGIFLFTRGGNNWKKILSTIVALSILLFAFTQVLTNYKETRDILNTNFIPYCNSETVKNSPQKCIKTEEEVIKEVHDSKKSLFF